MQQTSYKFLICGYYGAKNLGDDLILDSIINQLRDKYRSCQFFVTAIEPKIINTKYDDAQGVYHNDMQTIGKIIKSSSAVVIGGGGLIFEMPDIFGEVRPENNFFAPASGPSVYANYVYLANVYKKPALFWSIGIGPIKSDSGKALVRKLFESADYISVRDRRSLENLRKIGVKKDIDVVNDPAFLTKYKTIKDEQYMVVSLRPWRNESSEKMHIMKNVVARLAGDMNLKVIFLPFQITEDKFTNDLQECEKVARKLPRNIKWEIKNENHYDVLSGARCVLAMRLHAVIGTILSGKIPVALSYDSKVDDAMNEFGLEEYVVDINHIDEDDLIDLCKKAFVAQDSCTTTLSKKVKNTQDSTKKIVAALDNLELKKVHSVNFRTFKTSRIITAYNGGQIGDLEKRFLQMRGTTSWKISVVLAVSLKSPKNFFLVLSKGVKMIIRRVKWPLITLAKRILPHQVKAISKVFMVKHPYLSSPQNSIRRNERYSELAQIIKEHKKRKGIIVYAPTIDWNTPLHQRPHQLARSMAKRGYLVFFCTNNLRYDHVSGFEVAEKNLYITNQTVLFPRLEKQLILMISWAISKYYMQRFSDAFFVYDYMDDLNVFDGKKKELLSGHEFLLKESDLVLATADKLFDEVKGKNKNVILLPNGVDLDHFTREADSFPIDMQLITRQKKPIIGYYGAIAQWFDFELLKYVATKMPDFNFVIIGPLDYDKSIKQHSFKEYENVFFLGPKEYDLLPSYAQKFDVAMVPFKINEITEATSPIKLFEYMALGKPIVTTDMHECRKYKSVFIAKSEKDFVKKIKAALAKKDDKIYLAYERKEARASSWEKRGEELSKKLPKK